MGETFPYVYDARAFTGTDYELGVVDGDTQWLQLDLGFYNWMVDTLRLEDVDTHEIHFVDHDSEEYKRGIEEREFVKEWLRTAAYNYDGRFPVQVGITTYDHTGKYGRTLGYIRRKCDGEILNDRLLEEFDDVAY